MTEMLFRSEPYLREAGATVERLTDEGGIVLDQSLFYPTGGGQPGDSGRLAWDSGAIEIATTVKGAGDEIVLVPAEPTALPRPGTSVRQEIDWDRRYRLMRVHTALHLLSVVIPLPVTGGSIAEGKGRLDFDMAEAPENRDALEADLNRLIACDFPVTEEWISEPELDANPGLAVPAGSG